MWEFSVFRALGLLIRTWPFVLVRSAVHLAIAALLLVAAAAGAVAGRALAGGAGTPVDPAVWGGAAGLLIAGALIALLRGRLLYRMTVPHLAVMVETLDGRPLSWGTGQLAAARAIVAERFGDEPALLALAKLVRGVIRTATGLVDGLLTDILPVSALDRLARATGAELRLARRLVEAVVLGHAMRVRFENAWEAAHDGLVFYTQNARPMLTNALWLSLTGWGLAGVVALSVLSPLAGFAAAVPDLPWAGPLAAVLIGWAVKAALFDPFALACMVQLHLRLTEDQEPQPEWRGRLTQVSDKFRQLGERALGWRATPAQDA
jgi:hypothetical protein